MLGARKPSVGQQCVCLGRASLLQGNNAYVWSAQAFCRATMPLREPRKRIVADFCPFSGWWMIKVRQF
jgi:hypothetical protein